MSTPTCARCGSVLADGAVICRREAQELAETLLAAAGHAEDAEAVISRQTRYGAGGRGGKSEPLPVDLFASARYAAVSNTVGGWMRLLVEEGYAREPEPWRPLAGPLCPPVRPGDEPREGNRCAHGSCVAIRDQVTPVPLAAACGWLAGHVSALRKHPDAGAAFRELHDTCAQLERLVDRPATGDRLVGMCDCGKILYAPHGRDLVKCKACGQRWNVTKSQEILLGHLDGKLVTVPEALDMAGWLDVDRTREQIRKLLTGWAGRGQVLAHGQVWRDPTDAELEADPEVWQVAVPTYRFGEIRARLAETPRRNREGAAA